MKVMRKVYFLDKVFSRHTGITGILNSESKCTGSVISLHTLTLVVQSEIRYCTTKPLRLSEGKTLVYFILLNG